MDLAYVRRLFDYDSTAHERLLNTLRAADPLDADTRETFAHLLAAKQVWLARLTGSPADVPIWPDWSWDDCDRAIKANRSGFAEYLNRRSDNDLTAPVAYQNSRGTAFETPVRDILMHVLVHSGHHRGQIAAALRDQGHAPINTDYITHVRAPS
jgi:uncharacterized damage-inducible protein DinB